LRAVHEWCIDQGLTPYLHVDASSPVVKVPRPFVKNNEIVLNVSYDATGNFNISNEMVSFQARFSGVVQTIEVPLENVISLTAKETGEGVYLQQLRALQTMFQNDDEELPLEIDVPAYLRVDVENHNDQARVDELIKKGASSKDDDPENPPPSPSKGFHLKRIK
jgi:stringent starvation protein B